MSSPPPLWWSPTRGLITQQLRYDELIYVQVMDSEEQIGIGGRVLARLPRDAQPLRPVEEDR